jgi:hypothetical protein
MGREPSDAGYEWVNTWAASAMAETSAAMKGEDVAPVIADATPAAVPPLAPSFPDQLIFDIAEIERRRDALDALPIMAGASAKRRTQAFMLVPSHTSDMAPVVVGGVLALVMLTVFGAAAAMTKLAR